MKAIKILGSGCSNCRATARRVEQLAREMGVAITLEKVEEIQDIMSYGILATPGVVVDEKVVHSGGVPSLEKIAGWLASTNDAMAGERQRSAACGCGNRA